MDALEDLIAEWRGYVERAASVDGGDVEELEDHLRLQIADLEAAGLDGDEAFLVAVKRMGAVDRLSHEFAREHSGRLWKQLVLGNGPDGVPGGAREGMEALGFAVGAAISVQAARLASGFPGEAPTWLLRNLGLLVLPFLAGYFARRRRLDARGWMLTAAAFLAIGLVANLYPYPPDSSTELLVILHLPVVSWFVVAFPYTGGALGSHERRMDFVRFSGEWVIYVSLIALGGGVLLALTALTLEPIGPAIAERVVEWVLPSGAAGAVVVAGWLVESKQRVVENMAPVLTMLFTPLFAVMLTVAAVVYAATGAAGEFDRELLGVFDALLIVVLGLVLYAVSARDTAAPPGWMDRIRTLTVLAALALDAMVLGAMVARIDDLGFTPNRLAALGLNLVLLVNLSGTAWHSIGFLRGRTPAGRIERWQTSYLPWFGIWAAFVVVVLPAAFSFN